MINKCPGLCEYSITGDVKLKNKIEFNVKEIYKNSDEETKKKTMQSIVEKLIKKHSL